MASEVVHACTCYELLTEPAEALAKSSLVFAGQVTAVDVVELPTIVYFNGDPQPHQFMERRALVTLKVITEWKGSGAAEYRVLAGAPPVTPLAQGEVLVDCDVHLELGGKYLIFVDPSGYADVNPCAPTGRLEQSGKMTAALDRLAAQRGKTKAKK
jgi:hypothetical protein